MDEWFKDVLRFLTHNSRIYSFQLTKIFSEAPWNNIPKESLISAQRQRQILRHNIKEKFHGHSKVHHTTGTPWVTALAAMDTDALNNVPFQDAGQDNLPSSLNSFIATAIQLSLPRGLAKAESGVTLTKDEMRGMNPKKRHEVERMCDAVHTLCQCHGCSQIIDVGSGLGYLGQVLSKRYDYRVCGLESEESRTDGADTWIKKKSTDHNLINTVTFRLKDNEDCYTDFTQLVKELKQKHTAPDYTDDSGLHKHGCIATKITDECKSVTKCDGQIKTAEIYNKEGEITHRCDQMKKTCHNLKKDTESHRKMENDSESVCFCGAKSKEGTEQLPVDTFLPEGSIKHDCGNQSQTEVKDSKNSPGLKYCDKNQCGISTISQDMAKEEDLIPISQHTDQAGNFITTAQDTGKKRNRIISQAETNFITTSQDARSEGDAIQCRLERELDRRSCANSDEEAATNIRFSQEVCMTGLHCCGDLTPIVLKFFVRCPEVKCLVCFGCCYHNMSLSETGGFTQFPLSSQLQKELSSIKSTKVSLINTFALRLAAQETRSRWKNQTEDDHKYHTKHVAFRGLLELFCHQEGISLSKEKRKLAHKGDYKSLDDYIKAVYSRLRMEKSLEFVQQRMNELYKQYEEVIQYIEPITCLQVLLQPVLESLIIMDRVAFLQENGLTARPLPVFDEHLSPRNIAIVACKC